MEQETTVQETDALSSPVEAPTDKAIDSVEAAPRKEETPIEEAALPEAPEEPEAPAEERDYARQAEEDLEEIKRLDPAYRSLSHLSQLPSARRFAALRDLGLSVAEALAASNPRFPRENGKAHLRPSMDRGAASPRGALSGEEMRRAKELFSDLSDGEIQRLYRRVKST
ncbi:MAG: hypothetical protein IJY71_06295 [Clostridia bacterium]|nr:hypothetical protein [Clostridia bacterium]